MTRGESLYLISILFGDLFIITFFIIRDVFDLLLHCEKSMHIYRPLTQLREGNVVTGVCHSVLGVSCKVKDGWIL